MFSIVDRSYKCLIAPSASWFHLDKEYSLAWVSLQSLVQTQYMLVIFFLSSSNILTLAGGKAYRLAEGESSSDDTLSICFCLILMVLSRALQKLANLSISGGIASAIARCFFPSPF